MANNVKTFRSALGGESMGTLKGILSNAALRGCSIQLRMYGSIIQYKYEDEEDWIDLCDISQVIQDEVKDMDRYKSVDELPGQDEIQPGMIYILREDDN